MKENTFAMFTEKELREAFHQALKSFTGGPFYEGLSQALSALQKAGIDVEFLPTSPAEIAFQLHLCDINKNPLGLDHSDKVLHSTALVRIDNSHHIAAVLEIKQDAQQTKHFFAISYFDYRLQGNDRVLRSYAFDMKDPEIFKNIQTAILNISAKTQRLRQHDPFNSMTWGKNPPLPRSKVISKKPLQPPFSPASS